MTDDPVNAPAHYRQGSIETIDYIEQTIAHYPPAVGYSIGNCLKYISRAPHKGKMVEDLMKAQFYIARALGHLPSRPYDRPDKEGA
jgi:hypothetical protein